MFASNNSKSRYFPWLLSFLIGWLSWQFVVLPPTFNGTDFVSWGNDWNHFLCAITNGKDCVPPSKFPLAYLLNSFISSWAGPDSKHRILLAVNIVFALFSVYFLHRVSCRLSGRSVAPAFIAAITLTIIPPFYVYSGALEIQYGVMLGVFSICVYVMVVRKIYSIYISILLFLTSFALPLYKDISVLLIGGVCLAAMNAALPVPTINAAFKVVNESRRVMFIMAIGLVLSFLAMLSYNLFRYKNFLPIPYIAEAFEAAPPYKVKLSHLFWLIFSPNGGMIVAWSGAFITLLNLLSRNKLQPSKFGQMASVAVVGFSVITLANWWTPFGWEGWGNRLILPSAIAALMVLAATSVGDEVVAERCRALKVIYSYMGKLIVSILFLVSFLYIAVSYSVERNNYLVYSLWGTDACKAVGQLRDNRPMWEFKNSPIHLRCHQDRFSYVPGVKSDMSPLSIVDKRRYVIGNGKGVGVIGNGWSHLEEWGVWSDGHSAELRFLPRVNLSKILVELKPFIFGALTEQRITIILNEKPIASEVLTSTRTLEITLPEGVGNNPDEIVKLALELPTAASPVQLGLNADKRLLAVGLLSVEFQ